MKRDGLNFFTSSFFVVLSFLACFFIPCVAHAQYFLANPRYNYFSNAYNLTGQLQLTYEGRRTSDSGGSFSEQRFTHTYTLGLNGFVIDRRLIEFDLNGLFSQEIDSPGGTINSRGIFTTVTFLSEKAKIGILKYFPHPIQLRFSDDKTDGVRVRDYGVSLAYKPTDKPIFGGVSSQTDPPKKRPGLGQGGGPSGSDVFVPFPTFYLDYDRYRYSFHGEGTNSDHLDLRAATFGPAGLYTAEYNSYSNGGSGYGGYKTLDLRADIRKADQQKGTRLRVYNRLYYIDYGGSSTLDLSDLTRWSKQLGVNPLDLLTLFGTGDYTKSDGGQSYNLTASGIYGKALTPSLRNTVTASLGFGRSVTGPVYAVFAEDDPAYTLSRTFTVTNRFFGGATELGANYGAGLGLTANTYFINLAADYVYSSLALDEGRKDTHWVDLTLTGRLAGALTFSSRNSCHISRWSDSMTLKEKGCNLRADIYWNVSRFFINFGATELYLSQKGEVVLEGNGISPNPLDGVDGTGNGVAGPTLSDLSTGGIVTGVPVMRVTSVYANVSAPLARTVSSTLLSTYTKDSLGETVIDIHPMINWYFRQVFLTAEYEMIRTSGGSFPATVHRVFLRLTRSFSSLLRPFF